MFIKNFNEITLWIRNCLCAVEIRINKCHAMLSDVVKECTQTNGFDRHHTYFFSGPFFDSYRICGVIQTIVVLESNVHTRMSA